MALFCNLPGFSSLLKAVPETHRARLCLSLLFQGRASPSFCFPPPAITAALWPQHRNGSLCWVFASPAALSSFKRADFRVRCSSYLYLLPLCSQRYSFVADCIRNTSVDINPPSLHLVTTSRELPGIKFQITSQVPVTSGDPRGRYSAQSYSTSSSMTWMKS